MIFFLLFKAMVKSIYLHILPVETDLFQVSSVYTLKIPIQPRYHLKLIDF